MSSKMKVIYAIVFVILLVISIKAGFALQEDFNAYASQKVLYTCACSDIENIITLENTGDVASIYGITQKGSALPYSTFNPATFGLKPGESQNIHNFISVPCNVEGKFDLVTEVDTAFGLVKQLEQTVDIRTCVNVDVALIETPTEICPCSPVRYTFRIKNTGNFVDTYFINVTPYPEYISISEEFVVLGPGQSEDVYVFVATPCGMYGEIAFNLKVEAQRNGVIAELPFDLKINPCYEYSMTSADSFSVCKDLRNIVPVTVSNNADIANTYFLSTNSDWAFFDQSMISLAKKQATGVNVTLYPAAVPEGL
ncbi:MAG: hypothetical protein KKE20_02690, partial [Nanoarchaeota archaeon]|nr:hypothetical protein [Nanoarchaeota archaeon]